MPTSTPMSRKPTPQAPMPSSVVRPVRHSGAQRLLDEITLHSARALGIIEDDAVTVGRLHVDLLRALDADDIAHIPAWLAAANKKAVKELVAWHTQRFAGAVTPERVADGDDPGDPQDDAQRVAETTISFPRPRPQTPDDELVEYLKCRRSPAYFLDSYCHLEEKDRGIIPFRLWTWQAWLLYRWRANPKNIVLKARQIGVSELVAGYALWLTLFYATKRVILISKGEDDAQVLLGRAKTMLTHLPAFLFPSLPNAFNSKAVATVTITKDNTETLELVHGARRGAPHPSSIESLAATQGAGRSRTAALIVLDEWAHMLWGKQIWSSVKAAAGGRGGTVIGISTAFGSGNTFEEIWSAAATPDGSTNGFAPVFLSWRRHPERDDAWYAQEEREARANDDLPTLHQEYPREPIEAFIQSGRPVFDQAYLLEHSARIREEQARRAGEGLPPWEERDGLTIFEEPEAGYSYILGADVSEGRGSGDWQDASVVCRQTGREVAALRGHWPMDVYASKLDQLGWRYNTALLAVEQNGGGMAVVTPLLNGLAHEMWAGTRIAYPKLYHYKPEYVPAQHEDQRPGWNTNVRTKPLMVSAAQRMLREHHYLPRSRVFLDEATWFAWGERPNECGAPNGKHDDAVMSRMIAVYLLAQPDAAALALDFMRHWREQVEAKVGQARAAQGHPVAAVALTALTTANGGRTSASASAGAGRRVHALVPGSDLTAG